MGGREGKEKVERERRSSAGLIGDTQVGGRASRTPEGSRTHLGGVIAAGASRRGLRERSGGDRRVLINSCAFREAARAHSASGSPVCAAPARPRGRCQPWPR